MMSVAHLSYNDGVGMMDMLMMLAAAAAAVTAPQGDRVKPIDHCFAIYRPGSPAGTQAAGAPSEQTVIGATRQVIRAIRVGGRPAWDIVVHQRVPMANFAMRDHFVLNRDDLTPITFDNSRSGVEHVALRYTPGRIVGTKTDKAVVTPIDVAVADPIWEGNLWGVTFGALPLAMGKSFSLPFYQYDGGIGRFTLTVTGSQSVATPTGPVDAWTVAVLKDGKPSTTTLIAKRDARELGSFAARGGTKLGGDCTGLD